MAQMDHNEAVRLQAAEKYVLGEFPQNLRDEYEEHFFDCAECAVDLKAAAVFVDVSREVLRNEAGESVAKHAVPAQGRWFGWFRPIVAVPAFAALLLAITYQNSVTIPRAKEAATRNAGQLFTTSISLQAANTRGGEEIKGQVRPNESFALDFDFTPSLPFESYVCQLQDEAGRSLLQVSIPSSSANTEVHLVVPGGLVLPGRYHLVFSGDPGLKRQLARDEVLRLAFAIEFLH
jgi:hypothetical protein